MPGRRASLKIRYGVVPVDADWALFCDQHPLRRYSDRLLAITAGKRAVREAAGSGFEAELFLVDVGGQRTAIDCGGLE